MSSSGQWWPRVSVTGVLAVFAVATFAGLCPEPGVAVAMRGGSAPVAVAEPQPAATAPGALLAPVAAGRTIASRGGVTYALAGSALTLDDIPVRALAAYQRAATVIDAADAQCHLDWELVAALGKVLTDHGRKDGSELDDRGVPRPRLVGERLTGKHGTQRVPDSDAGELDGDARVDRGVGPLMLLPSVWSVVSVDGDGDGRRNPQDVDDAALGAAVFLCAGDGDLRNPAHRRSEVRRFHSGADTVRSVLSVRNAYQDAGELTTVSVLAREEGVAVAPTSVALPSDQPTDQVLDQGSQFDPAAEPTTAAPSPAASPSATPQPSATPVPSPSGSASPSGTPTPSATPTPSGSPSPTDEPTTCVTPTPTPTASPTANPTVNPGVSRRLGPCPTETPTPSASPTTTTSPLAAEQLG